MIQIAKAAPGGRSGAGRRAGLGALPLALRCFAVTGLLLLVAASAWGATRGVVNINTASAAELQLLPGIGARRAVAILAARQARGGFSQAEDLMEVDGIGAVMLERMRAHVALKGATTARRVDKRASAAETDR